MKKLLAILMLWGTVSPVMAQSISNELDAAARSAKGNSVLFRNSDPEEMMRYQAQEEMEQRRAYEAEMKRRAEEARQREQAQRQAYRPVNLFGRSLKIFAVVNGDVITSRDMQDRVNAFVATTQIPINSQTKQMVIDKVLEAAVDEKIKLQEAEKNGVEISPADLDKGMQNFAKANGVSMSKMRQMLKQAQVDEDVFKSQMKAEMAWTRLIQRKSAEAGQVSQGEINEALKSISRDIEIPKFMVSEIVIPKKKASHIHDLVDNLRNDPRFELYAMQFSQSPSARNGGRIGWVNKGQLAAPLENVLVKMKEGAISNPIAVGNDYYILKLEKIYTPGSDKAPMPNENEVKAMLQNKKMEETAAKYIRDLRNKAIIERKV